jgi:hypothetical protein
MLYVTFFVTMSVITLSVIMLKVTKLSVTNISVTLSVVMLNVKLLSVTFLNSYAKVHIFIVILSAAMLRIMLNGIRLSVAFFTLMPIVVMQNAIKANAMAS